jgi:phosphoribosylformylglycinamidine synthase
VSTSPFNGPRRGVRFEPSATLSAGSPPATAKVHRVEIWPRREDVRAQALSTKVRREHHAEISAKTAKVYLIQGDLDDQLLLRVAASLLADPVTETFRFGSEPAAKGASIIEVHPLPGVMDPAAQSVREAIVALLGAGTSVDVVTGVRYDIAGVDASKAKDLVARTVANPVVHEIHEGAHTPDHLPRGSAYTLQKRVVRIRELSAEELATLSRRAHLFMSGDEMRAVQAHYQTLGRDPTDIELETLAQTWSEHCVHKTLKSKVVYRESAPEKPAGASGAAGVSGSGPGGAHTPTQNPAKPPRIDVSFAFSPKGKALPLREERPAPATDDNSPTDAGVIDFSGRPGHTVGADGTVTIDNLLKNTIAAATFELIKDGCDWALSVFKDNSGVVAFDDTNAVCIKVETHNRPSAIEPYGGAATGIGGCIRDIIGTGLGARPIASMDVFCVAEPDHWRTGADDKTASKDAKALPPGVLHARRILSDVVAGVRDYGNRMGIPTVNGAVFFDDRYVGNPLVFCGCVGLIPNDRVHATPKAGDRIIALGGRTGRDGIHGATFSSAELESSASTEFAHAVQIGNAIEEKRVLEAIMRARDAAGGPLYSAMTDCGAGGFSSAVGEMGKDVGAAVELDRAPTKYAGLSYTEIWISEAQERMVLAVPPGNVAAIKAICDEEGVELADLGEFGAPDKQLVLNFMGEEVGRMSMDFLHDGIPSPTRVASWSQGAAPAVTTRAKAPGVRNALRALLAHPNIASKHWIIRQYDHEVRGGTITKPLVGPGGRGPSDAAVIEPTPREGTALNQRRAIAIGCGVSPWTGDEALGGDPYHMAINAIDECVRNLVCSGTDPRRIAILDNFCWPSCDRPENMGALVRACEGCYDGAMAYRTPFVSGKDSLNNQLRYDDNGTQRVIEIPRTLLITGLGYVGSLTRCVTMDAKHPENLLMLIGGTSGHGARGMGGSHYQRLFGLAGEREVLDATVPTVDLEAGPRIARAVAQCIADGLVRSAHDVSDGGVLACIAEMLIATTGARRGGEAPANLYASTLAQLMSGGTAVPPLGAELTMWDDLIEAEELAFTEAPCRYVIEVRAEDVSKVRTVLTDHGGVRASVLGKLTDSGRLVWEQGDVNEAVDELADIWRTPLDW